MPETRKNEVSAVAALDEPNRRRLYDHVVRQPVPVSRDDAAAALNLPRATAAFHLDRLVQEGLLVVTYERRTGRTGPGAGRPAKLYRRSERQVAVTIPQRRYDLAGQLLAAAMEDAERTGESPRSALRRHAFEEGRRAAATEETVRGALEAHGYEPRPAGTGLIMANCPFHTLAQRHTQLVCEMNLHLIEGLLRGLDATALRARLVPAPPHCCVRVDGTAVT